MIEKMIVHMFPKSQFAEGFVSFIQNHFDTKKHKVILYTNQRFELPMELYELEFVRDYDKENLFWLYRELIAADKIIFHNLSVTLYVMLMVYMTPSIAKKASWLVWGGDLYCYRNRANNIIDKFVEHMRRVIIARLPYIATLTKGDYELARKWYKTDAKNIRVNYCDEGEINILKNVKKTDIPKMDTVNILLGNSATESNHHIDMLDALSKFKNEDICIYVPLSYGNIEYAKKVKEYGSRIFCDKIVYIEEFMDRSCYFSLLAKMQVTIFNHDRQQALGNIFAMLYLGKKIYLREGTAMWSEITDSWKYNVFPTGKIKNETLRELCKYNSAEQLENMKIAERFYDVNSKVVEWTRLFEVY